MDYGKLISISDDIMIRELKMRLGYTEGIFEDGEEPSCVFCGTKAKLFYYKKKYYCIECYREMLYKLEDE